MTVRSDRFIVESISDEQRTALMAEFGRRISDLRRRRRWSKDRLARESSLTERSVEKIEQGEQQPLLATIVLLAEGLGISPAALLAHASLDINARRVSVGKPDKA